jgi:hypothetical protein
MLIMVVEMTVAMNSAMILETRTAREDEDTSTACMNI